jgi:hypothetical protein
MRGGWSDVRQSTAAEVPLDAGKSVRLTASAQSIDRFDRLLRARCAIYRCPSRPKGHRRLTTAGNPENVGSRVADCDANGRAILPPDISNAFQPTGQWSKISDRWGH